MAPWLGMFDAFQVRLLEAEIGERGHLVVSRYWPQYAEWDLIFADVWLVEVGLRVQEDGLLLGGSRGRVQVVVRRGIALDMTRLYQRGNLGRRVVVHAGSVGRCSDDSRRSPWGWPDRWVHRLMSKYARMPGCPGATDPRACLRGGATTRNLPTLRASFTVLCQHCSHCGLHAANTSRHLLAIPTQPTKYRHDG